MTNAGCWQGTVPVHRLCAVLHLLCDILQLPLKILQHNIHNCNSSTNAGYWHSTIHAHRLCAVLHLLGDILQMPLKILQWQQHYIHGCIQQGIRICTDGIVFCICWVTASRCHSKSHSSNGHSVMNSISRIGSLNQEATEQGDVTIANLSFIEGGSTITAVDSIVWSCCCFQWSTCQSSRRLLAAEDGLQDIQHESNITACWASVLRQEMSTCGKTEAAIFLVLYPGQLAIVALRPDQVARVRDKRDCCFCFTESGHVLSQHCCPACCNVAVILNI